MKKSLALGLALAMVLSMGAAVSAKTDESLYPVGSISESAYLYSSDDSAVDMTQSVDKVSYGEVLYFPLLNTTASEENAEFLYVYESEAVSGIKVKQSWDMNSKLVKGVEIVKKKVVGVTLPTAQKYIYFVAVSLADSSSTSSVDVVGEIQLRKSGSFDYEDMQLDVNFEVSYPEATSTEITEDLQIFKEGIGFAGDTEEELTFECDSDSYFVVNTIGQGKLLLSATNKFDAKIAELYPNANLNFFYGNGASFNKTGTLYLAADEGSYLYQINSDGSMVKVDAEYDEYDEAFVIKTRTLGKYVISDTALTIVNAPVQGEGNGGNVVVTPSNPSTGAAL